MQINYLTSEYIIKVHNKVLEISGGKDGIKDYGNIESPLYHVQNDDYYPSFESKLTHIVFSIIKFHAFNDGNKRTAIVAGASFMIINGLDVFVQKFMIEMENIVVEVADNKIDKPLLCEIICSIISEEDFNEVLKLKIVNALSNY